MPRSVLWLVAAVAVVGLTWFYVAGATEHARRVNVSKARGDQSGYLWDAENVYANRHGRTPPILIGERNRMPLYAGYLSLFYNPQMSDPEFWEVGKTWNIRLSVALIAALALVFAATLPPLLALNLSLIVAFTIFVFKAGYTQSELLFYALFFGAFLALWRLFDERVSWRQHVGLAFLGGALSALAHLTKASVPPLLAVFAVVFVGRALGRPSDGRSRLSHVLRASATTALVIGTFLAVLSPYLLNNKRTFGAYFYNVNTTFYAWYDDWAHASVGTILHGDGVGWPTMPDQELPSLSRYWHTHSVHRIAERVASGLADMIWRSYTTFWYFNYVVIFLVLILIVAMVNRAAVRTIVRAHRSAIVFLVLYAVAYLLSIAFYAPISGTGTTRFLMAHLTPFFFVASRFFAHPAIATTAWRNGRVRISLQQAHVLVLVVLAYDIGVDVWPRLMTTYGGF